MIESTVPDDELRGRLSCLDLDGRRVAVLGTVKGLTNESRLVEMAAREIGPEAIAVHIGKEELKGLESVLDGDVDSAPLSSYEKVYARKLSVFGDIQIPPPSLVEALRAARSRKIPCLPLDFNDERYSSVYTRHIDGLTMIRQSLRLKRVNRKRFPKDDLEGFTVKWDRVANAMRGFRKLEKEREGHMARRIGSLSGRYDPLLCVVELERKNGILEEIGKLSGSKCGV